MSYSVSIGTSTFAKLGNPAQGRYLLSAPFPSVSYKIITRHVPGQNGNYVVRCGRNGTVMPFKLLYVGALDWILDAYGDDTVAWENTAVQIVTPIDTYDTCNLIDMRITRDPRAIGRSGLCDMEVSATFRWDG